MRVGIVHKSKPHQLTCFSLHGDIRMPCSVPASSGLQDEDGISNLAADLRTDALRLEQSASIIATAVHPRVEKHDGPLDTSQP